MRRLVIFGIILGTGGWDGGCKPHCTIKKSLMVYWNCCRSEEVVCLKDPLVGDVFGLETEENEE